VRAFALISGGLDSALAAKLIQKQGIEVIGLRFHIPFFTRAKNNSSAPNNAFLSSLGINIQTVDISQEYLEVLMNPRYGYGSNMNPCVDCKIFMLKKAKELMPQYDAQFVVTGEVLGQRPMSQNRQMLDVISKRSGLQDLLLRPLSAKLLLETKAEKEGWVKREALLSINGRGRHEQVELAAGLGIKDYPQPAGGCLLTDPQFSLRLKDLISHNELNLSNVELLKIGRHFRISPGAKLIVGRDQNEDEELLKIAKDSDYLFFPNEELAGPTCLGRGVFDEKLIQLSANMACRYCDLEGSLQADICWKYLPDEEINTIKAVTAEEQALNNLRI